MCVFLFFDRISFWAKRAVRRSRRHHRSGLVCPSFYVHRRISKKMRKPGFGLNRNHYFAFGFLLGLFLSFYIPENVWDLVQSECPELAQENILIEKFGEDFEPHLNLINKPLAAKKPVSSYLYCGRMLSSYRHSYRCVSWWVR